MKKFTDPPTKGVQQTIFPNGDIAYTWANQLVVIPAPRHADAPPPPAPPPSPQFPELVNGDMEGAGGWVAYRMDGPVSDLLLEPRDKTEPGIDPLAVYHGDKSLMLSGFNRCWRGGVYQTVPNVPVGQHVRISAWVMTYGSNYPGCRNVNINMNSLIGIGFDPLGLADPNAGRVDWRMIPGGDTTPVGSVYDPKWTMVTHETVTTSHALTIFLNADLGALSLGRANWPMPFTRAHFDAVTVEVLS